MTETIETQDTAPSSHEPNPEDVTWYQDLNNGTGAAEGMDPALRATLAKATVDRATAQAATAGEIPWRKDLIEGTGAAEGMDPALRAVLAKATTGQATEQAGKDMMTQESVKSTPEADGRTLRGIRGILSSLIGRR